MVGYRTPIPRMVGIEVHGRGSRRSALPWSVMNLSVSRTDWMMCLEAEESHASSGCAIRGFRTSLACATLWAIASTAVDACLRAVLFLVAARRSVAAGVVCARILCAGVFLFRRVIFRRVGAGVLHGRSVVLSVRQARIRVGSGRVMDVGIRRARVAVPGEQRVCRIAGSAGCCDGTYKCQTKSEKERCAQV